METKKRKPMTAARWRRTSSVNKMRHLMRAKPGSSKTIDVFVEGGEVLLRARYRAMLGSIPVGPMKDGREETFESPAGARAWATIQQTQWREEFGQRLGWKPETGKGGGAK